MTNLTEASLWEDGIHQIQRGEKVVGGKDGVANIQAGQLANRTQYLKTMIDDNPDYRKFTFYKTSSDPDGTKSGLAATTDGQSFRVPQGMDSVISFIYYRNDAGKAVAVSTSSAAGSAMIFDNAAAIIAFTPPTSNALAMDGSSGDFYFWKNGDWQKAPSDIAGLRAQVLKSLVGLQALVTSVAELAPLPDVVAELTAKNVALAQNGQGNASQVQKTLVGLHVLNAAVAELSPLADIVTGLSAQVSTLSSAKTSQSSQLQQILVGLHALSSAVAELEPISDIVADISVQVRALNGNGKNLSSQAQQTLVGLHRVSGAVAELAPLSDSVANIETLLASVSKNTFSQIQQLQVANATLAQSLSLFTDDKDYQDFKMKVMMSLQMLGSSIAPLEGFDPKNVATKDASTVSQEMFTNQYTFGEPGRIIRLNITTPTVPVRKDDPPVNSSITIDIDGSIFTAYTQLSVQGASSAGYAKKNLNIDFFTDERREDSLELKIGSVLPHDEWTFKANWIDHTHTRNLMSYRLWMQFMNSRGTWPMWDTDQPYVGATGIEGVPNGATGIPLGYPCILYINGDFYGIGSFMLGKKRPNYNVAKNKPNQIWMNFDSWTDITNIDMTKVEMKAPSKPTAETDTVLANFQKFARSSQADFTAAAPSVLNKNNAIDFFIFSDFIVVQDLIGGNNAKNFIMITRDGVQWFFMPYDLDTVFGLEWNGKSIAWPSDYKYMTGSFWAKIRNTYLDDINKRYAYLRTSGVISVANIYKQIQDITSKYTQDMFEAEFAKWTGLPSLTVTSVDQILNWTAERIAYLDIKYSYTA